MSAAYEWQKGNQELMISDFEMQRSRVINNIFEDYYLEDLNQLVHEAYKANFRQLEQKQVRLSNRLINMKKLPLKTMKSVSGK